MTRRSKKETVMFALVMIAMTSTILGMDHTDSYEDASDRPKQKTRKPSKCMISSSSSEEIDVIEQQLKTDDLNNDDDVMVYEPDEKIGHQTKGHKIEKPRVFPTQEGGQVQVKMEEQIKILEEVVAENDPGKQLNAENSDSTNQKTAPSTNDDNKMTHKSESHDHKTKRPRRNQKMSVENFQHTPVKVKQVKNKNLFATFLEYKDAVKYTLVHTRHENFSSRIPLHSVDDQNDKEAAIYWNPNTFNVVKVHFGSFNNRLVDRREEIFETEKLKLVNELFSRFPDTKSLTDYDFFFDLTDEGKKWSILALHKQKTQSIGRQWKYITKNTYQIGDFEPCDFQNRWINKKSTDGISKTLLALGFNFPRDPFRDAQNLKEKSQDGRSKDDKFDNFLYPQNDDNVKYEWDGEKRVYCRDVEEAEKNNTEKHEHNLQYALREKLDKFLTMDKSAKFLMSSYSDMKENAPPGPDFLETYFDENRVTSEWNRFSIVVNDEDVIKAFHSNLCESFKFLMESRSWPEELWRRVLDSERQQSNEMITLLLERIKKFPKEEHLDILLKTNDNGKMAFFDKAMHLTDNELSSRHLKNSLMILSNKVRAQLYQYLLFFGVVKGDSSLVRFAVNGSTCVSLQEKVNIEVANALASKFCWCEKAEKVNKVKLECMEDKTNDSNKKEKISGEHQEYSKDTNGMNDRNKKENDRDCLHLALRGKTALEIATNLAKDGVEGARNKNNFKSIKTYLECEARKGTKKDKTKKDKGKMMALETDSVICLDDSDNESKNNKRKRKDIDKKR